MATGRSYQCCPCFFILDLRLVTALSTRPSLCTGTRPLCTSVGVCAGPSKWMLACEPGWGFLRQPWRREKAFQSWRIWACHCPELRLSDLVRALGYDGPRPDSVVCSFLMGLLGKIGVLRFP